MSSFAIQWATHQGFRYAYRWHPNPTSSKLPLVFVGVTPSKTVGGMFTSLCAGVVVLLGIILVAAVDGYIAIDFLARE